MGNSRRSETEGRDGRQRVHISGSEETSVRVDSEKIELMEVSSSSSVGLVSVMVRMFGLRRSIASE